MALQFPTLQAAVDAFDAGGPERDRLWDNINSAADVATAEAQCLADMTALREAFYQATKDINSREDCARVPHEFIRRMAKLEAPGAT